MLIAEVVGIEDEESADTTAVHVRTFLESFLKIFLRLPVAGLGVQFLAEAGDIPLYKMSRLPVGPIQPPRGTRDKATGA
jgi:hypothetical protein